MISVKKTAFVKVLCESCLNEFAGDCLICGGTRYYFWDPVSSLCYLASGEPMRAENDEGDLLNVVRKRPERHNLSLDVMLSYIELWAKEDPKRTWSMAFDGEWNCAFSFDRSKNGEIKVSNSSVNAAIAECYDQIIAKGNAK